MLKRLNIQKNRTDDQTLQATFNTNLLSTIVARLTKISPAIDRYQPNKKFIASSSMTKGLEQVSEDEAIRSWNSNAHPMVG